MYFLNIINNIKITKFFGRVMFSLFYSSLSVDSLQLNFSSFLIVTLYIERKTEDFSFAVEVLFEITEVNNETN